jgi:2-amino-4-hydroxy-6-hydroxymethyldihydropteridine diphosphokinase
MRAVLALGSNLGDREATMRDAVVDIQNLPGVTLVAASALVETPAVKLNGVDHEAPAYLNAVVIIETDFEPEQLLVELGRIELAHHRTREERWGDRTLDLDIVSIDDLQQQSATLTLPHPRAAGRDFVLVPWLDADPDAAIPGVGRVDSLPAGAVVLPRRGTLVTPAKELS